MKRLWLIIPLLFGLANARPWGKILKSHWLAEEIGLTKEQKSKIEGILLESEKKIAEIEPKLRIKRMELEILMGEPNPDESKAKILVEEIGKLRTKILLIHIQRRIGMKKILTSEQQKKLMKFLMEHKRRPKRRFRP